MQTTQKKLSVYLEKHLESSQMDGDNKRNENNNVGEGLEGGGPTFAVDGQTRIGYMSNEPANFD